jgi:tetratricopeptide (TPR) repeat protein
MKRSSKAGPAPEAVAPPATDSPRHFDTFETKFFEQGDAAHPHAQVEGFEDLEEPALAKKRAPWRPYLLAVAVGAVCAAVLGGVTLWRGGRVSPKPAVATPASASVPAIAPQGDPDPPAPTEPATLPAASAPPPPAAVAAPRAAAPAPEAVAEVEAPPEEAPDVAPPDPAAVRAACEKAIRGGRARRIIRACADAFAADPTVAEIAVAVAKAELDRGRSAQALAWGKKAVGADPNVADAYVFIGGAEQNAGRGKAAKQAYQRYLELAPKGRYAADLRAIVGRL